MTRLEKYLLASAEDIIYSETTESRYFIVGNIKVRVSDHFSNNNNSDLQVIIPYNGGTKYIVVIKESPGKFLLWNAQQIHDFIPSLQIMKGVRSPVTKRKTPELKKSAAQKIQMALNSSGTVKGTSSLALRGELIKTKLKEKNCTAKQREILRKPKSTWDIAQIGTLPPMFREELNCSSGVNEDMQIFLTCTSLTYEEVLNIFKIVVIDNNKVPTITLLQEALSLIQ